jgi:hypothetical protein
MEHQDKPAKQQDALQISLGTTSKLSSGSVQNFLTKEQLRERLNRSTFGIPTR